jgi:probable rRNA maturation factor
VTVLNRQRARKIDPRGIAGFLERISREVRPDGESGLSIKLVSDRAMQEFNRRYRGIPSTTDVLSFPVGDEGPSPDPVRYLGDIVISVPAAVRQASEAGHSVSRELKILSLHGYLHLMGYDHETDNGTMLRLQRRLIRKALP